VTQSRSTLGGAIADKWGDIPPQAKACLQPVADTVQFDDVIRKFGNGIARVRSKGRLYVAAVVDLFSRRVVGRCTQR